MTEKAMTDGTATENGIEFKIEKLRVLKFAPDTVGTETANSYETIDETIDVLKSMLRDLKDMDEITEVDFEVIYGVASASWNLCKSLTAKIDAGVILEKFKYRITRAMAENALVVMSYMNVMEPDNIHNIKTVNFDVEGFIEFYSSLMIQD